MNNCHIITPFFLDSPQPNLERLSQPEWRLNKPVLRGTDQFSRLTAIHRPLKEFVFQASRRGERPVCIGGDCCAAIGVLAGLQESGVRPTLVWLDAHGDFNTYETSPSGFVGGMPLAMIVGHGDQTLVKGIGFTPLAESGVFLADARDLDPGEKTALHSSAVHHARDFSMLSELLPADPLYVHLDVDVLNPQDAPAMLYPAQGGPSREELCNVARAIARTHRVVAVSVTVWDFDKDGNKRTEAACLDVLHSLIAEPSPEG